MVEEAGFCAKWGSASAADTTPFGSGFGGGDVLIDMAVTMQPDDG